MDRILDIIQRNTAPVLRWHLAVVTNVDMWTDVGEAYIVVTPNGLAGGERLAVYRDGRQPKVGDFVQVAQMSGSTASYWLALPIVQECTGILYASVQRLSDSTWHICRCDFSLGGLWEYVCPSPTGGGQRVPLYQTLGQRLFTWNTNTAWTTSGTLYYSDDHGASWSSAGISITNMARRHKYGASFAIGSAGAYISKSKGASWTSLGSPGSGFDIDVYAGSLAYDIDIVTAGGAYHAYTHNWVLPFLWNNGPWTPGGKARSESSNFAGSFTQIPSGDNYYYTGGAGTGGAATPVGNYARQSALDPGMRIYRTSDYLINDTRLPGPILATELTASNTPAQWPIEWYGYIGASCEFTAIDNPTGFKLFSQYIDADGVAGPEFSPIDNNLAAVVGGDFRVSADGLTILQWLEYNYGYSGGLNTDDAP